MSGELNNPFKRVIAAHQQRMSDAHVHHQRMQRCAEKLVNQWRQSDLQPVILEFNQVAHEARLNLTVQHVSSAFARNEHDKAHLEYAVVPLDTMHARPRVSAKLRLELEADYKAHANLKNEQGEEFVLPLEGAFPAEEARELFAALLRECLKPR